MEEELRRIILHRYTVKNPTDLILQNLPQSVVDTCYKCKLVQQRIGLAWEAAPVFFGWDRGENGIDLINHETKQVVEVKNNAQTDNSSSRPRNYDELLEYTSAHPGYSAVYVIINDNTDKDVMKYDNRIRYVSGIHAMRVSFGEDSQIVIRILKRLVTEFLTTSNLSNTNCNK